MSAPTVRRRRLGVALRNLRENADLKLEHVADRAGITVSKLSRVELARVAAKPVDVEKLLDVYQVAHGDQRELLVTLAREGGRRGWWQTYQDILSPVYADLISLEAEASTVRTFEPLLLPGLFQTSSYARAVISAITMVPATDNVNALVEVRMARQSVLTRPDPLHVWAIIHEAALKPVIMGTTIMRDQMQRLLDLSELSNVTLQVMPENAAPHPGTSGGFTILGFPEQSDLDVVLLENLSNSLYIEEAKEVEVYGAAFERLRAAALPFDRSLETINHMKDGTT